MKKIIDIILDDPIAAALDFIGCLAMMAMIGGIYFIGACI